MSHAEQNRPRIESTDSRRRARMRRYLLAAVVLTFLVLACAAPLARLGRGAPHDPEDPKGIPGSLRGDLGALRNGMDEIHRELEKDLDEELEKTLEEQIATLKVQLEEVDRELEGTPDAVTRELLEEQKRDLEDLKRDLELELEKRLYKDLEEVRRELDDQDFAHRAYLSEVWHELREWKEELEDLLEDFEKGRKKR